MDGERFDTIAKGLATGSSRRRVIGGVLGSAAALLAGGTTLAAKRKRGAKAKGRQAKVSAQGKGQPKVTLCHWDEDTNVFEKITVGGPAANGSMAMPAMKLTSHSATAAMTSAVAGTPPAARTARSATPRASASNALVPGTAPRTARSATTASASNASKTRTAPRPTNATASAPAMTRRPASTGRHRRQTMPSETWGAPATAARASAWWNQTATAAQCV